MNKGIMMLLLVVTSLSLNAQDLLRPMEGFSKKKTSYLTMMDGSEVKGTLKSFERKKGLVTLVKIKDGDGKIQKIKASEIKCMYLPQSGLDKLNKITDVATDFNTYMDDNLNQDILSEGYAYFELADVKVKKKTLKLQMQLLNPGFSKSVKVYHDPYARETASFGVAGMKLAGGIAKSYYISKGGETAFRLFKKGYKSEFKPLWNSCSGVGEAYPNVEWSDFTKHIIAYSECQK